ncbi:hypothetical protein ABH935_009556 [Catenulispora sp. GAS73]
MAHWHHVRNALMPCDNQRTTTSHVVIKQTTRTPVQ